MLSNEEREKFRKEYYARHRNCPRCYSSYIETTCMGYFVHDPLTFKDKNRAQCCCGWVGITHDLIMLDNREINDKLRNTLSQIASQKKSFELLIHGDENPDYQYAYDMMIAVAREALK